MPRLIRFRDLIKRDRAFHPCPNCGETAVMAVMQGRWGWDGLVADDPECQKCKFRFVKRKSRWLRRRMFAVMSPEEHQQYGARQHRPSPFRARSQRGELIVTNQEPSPAFGLSLLVSPDKDRWSDIDEAARNRISLIDHPFGLELPEVEVDWEAARQIIFLSTGSTNVTVDAMIAHINWAIGGGITEGPTKLRVILADRGQEQHYVFFEMWSDLGVFICGDCTDFSGGGGHGKHQMESVFALLAATYNLEVERITFPPEQGKPMMAALDRQSRALETA